MATKTQPGGPWGSRAPEPVLTTPPAAGDAVTSDGATPEISTGALTCRASRAHYSCVPHTVSAAADPPVWSALFADRTAGGIAHARVNVDIPFPDGLGTRVAAVAEQLGATASTVAFALVAEVLRRYCGDTVMLQLTSRALHACVGDESAAASSGFVTAALDLSDDPTLRLLSARIQALVATVVAPSVDDQPHSTAPIVVDILPNSATASTPTAPELAGALADLHCLLYIDASTVCGRLAFDAQRYELGTMRAVAAALARLAESACADPNVALSQHQLLDRAMRTRVLDDWNATAIPRAADAVMHRLFERHVESTPGAIAAEHAGHALTFRELNTRANRLARVLVQRGVHAGVLVAVSMERSLELMVAVLAVLKAGGAFVPLDPDLPPERLTYILGNTRAPLLLVQSHLADRLQTAATMAAIGMLQIPPVLDALAGQSENLPDRSTSSQVAYVIYTSGSTGQPKGVRVSHRALCNHALWFAGAIDLTPNDRMLQYASIGFDAAMAELFAPLVVGAPVVLAPPYAHRDVLGVGDLFRANRITVAQMVPSALRAALAGDAFADPTPLRYLVSGGEVLDHALVAAVRSALPGVRIGNFYGPSEACVDSTMIEIDASLLGRRAIPIGRPIANVRCHVLDRHLHPVPIGAPGELFIGGLGLADGYHEQPALTAARFIADPFRSGDRLYRSGDRARYYADGTLEYLGRVDTQVKLRGYRIELAEIETALLSHPGIRDAAVIVRTDDAGEPALVAYLVCAAEVTPPPAQAIISRLRQRVPSYAVPSAFGFLDALPLTSSAKLDRRALAQQPLPLLRADTDPSRPALTDPVEHRLRIIWEATLGVSPVSVDDDFFELGGHSLKAIRLLNDVEREFGLDVRPGVLFEASTIRRFGARLRERQPRPVTTTIPVQPDGSALPLFVVPGGGGELFVFEALARELGAEQPLHVMDLYAFGEQHETGAERITIGMEEIAARMIGDMRHIQAHGPYQLAGYSLGGNIALEIAQQLRRRGEEVGMLLMLDCDGPGYPRLQPFLQRTLTHLRYAVSLDAGDTVQYVRDRVRQLLRRIGGAPPPDHTLFDKELELVPIPPNVVERMERALQPVVRAWEGYVPGRYDGPVTLVRATIRQPMVGVVDVDPLLGWGGVLTNLRTESMACGHFDVLRASQAPRLAAIVSTALNALTQR